MIFVTDGVRYRCVDCGKFVSRNDAYDITTHLCRQHLRLWLECHDGAGEIQCPASIVAYFAQFEASAAPPESR